MPDATPQKEASGIHFMRRDTMKRNYLTRHTALEQPDILITFALGEVPRNLKQNQ